MKSIKLIVITLLLLVVPVFTYGQDTLEAAKKFYDLGMSDRQAKKHDSAIENLKKALAIYEKDGAKDSEALVKTLIYLSDSSALEKKYNEGEQFIVRAVSAGEEFLGRQDVRMLVVHKSASDFYYNWGKHIDRKIDDKKVSAHLLLLESLAARHQVLSKLPLTPARTTEKTELENEFICYAYANNSWQNGLKRRFEYAIKTGEPMSATEITYDPKAPGSARSLPKPAYKAHAKMLGPYGAAIIRIQVDETGTVVTANAICGGDELFTQPAEKAALQSKFYPFLKDGRAIGFNGFIAYSFQR